VGPENFTEVDPAACLQAVSAAALIIGQLAALALAAPLTCHLTQPLPLRPRTTRLIISPTS